MTVTAAALVLAWVVLILLAFAVAGLLRMVRELQETVATGAAAAAPDLVGRTVAALAGDATTTLVVDPGCMMCGPTLEAFDKAAGERTHERLRVVTHQVSPDWPQVRHVQVTADESLYRELDVPWTPALLITDAAGVISAALPLDGTTDLADQLPPPAPTAAAHAYRS